MTTNLPKNLLRYGRAALLAAGMVTSLGVARPASAATVLVSTCQTITVPGYYKVMNDLKANGAAGCMRIDADDVTLDLNKHEIRNNGGKLGYGVYVVTSNNVPHTGVKLRNGTIGTFATGVMAADTVGMQIENLASNVNGGYGISVGPGAIVRNVQVRQNGADGIFAGAGSFLSNVIADGNFSSGMRVGQGSRVQGSSATFNVAGIVMVGDGGGVASGNVAEGNKSVGILVDCPSRVENNKLPQYFPNGTHNVLMREIDILLPGPTFLPRVCSGTQVGAVVTKSRTNGLPVQ